MTAQKTQRKATQDEPAKPRQKTGAATRDSTEAPAAQPARRPNEKVRARMRSRLMVAARAVMARKGIEGTAINDITDEAQVAFGSFYNYFSSKEEIARAVFVGDVTAIADLLDRNRPTEEDIALIVGLNIQWTLRHAIGDPIWGWFLIHTESSVGDLMENMTDRLMRDIRTGVKSGHFCSADVLTSADVIIGGALRILRQILEGRRPAAAIDQFVAFTLRGLGVDKDEAARVVKSSRKYNVA
ncbi:TetR/AcrR family transcriptional regulator [Paraburkholderia sp.]|uniref:TetR/AcrR family transcriptional regulator n=1 Tax=Paraburkholderia sp. TaxID=1926495 RepID=UPI002D5C746D|nr:TetR/AcrR family transcriptional regulator [Paraburkholderia sp.]HZZ02653.1 TetR/AcrR family transcriptional regulator [Paraburkholderia sp.]